MQSRALRADLLMLLTAAIWGSVFVAQQKGMESIGPFLYSGLRFVLGTLVLLPLLLLRPAPTAVSGRSLWQGGIALGVVLAVAMNFQQVGLLFTSVTNAGFITGLYVIFVPLLALFTGHRAGRGTWFGAGLAVVGMAMLSIGPDFHVSPGDGLQLVGAVLWALHVLLVGALAARHDPLRLAMIQFGTCAVVSLVLAGIFEPFDPAAVQAALPAILYGGLCGVAIGFTLQIIAQRHAIASHAAIIFSLEAVFAAIAGAVFLNETLNMKGYLGCILMLAGMLVAQLWRRREPVAPLPQTGR